MARKKDEALEPKSSELKEDIEAAKAPGIEESFKLLDELLSKIEDEETPLEESFKLYEEGLKLVKNVDAQITRVEQKLRILSGEAEEGDAEDV